MVNYQQGDVCNFCGGPLTQSKTSGKWYCKACYQKRHNQPESQPVQKNGHGRNQDRSFALSYAKDLTIAFLQVTKPEQISPVDITSKLIKIADIFYNWLVKDPNKKEEWKSPVNNSTPNFPDI